MNVHGYEITKDWSVSSSGMIAYATKRGKKYILKKYGQFKKPQKGPSTSDALYARLLAEFEDFKKNRIAINEALSSFAGPGGNIILPNDWFMDDVEYVEATEFVNGVVDDADVLRLPREELLFVMLTGAGALAGMHRVNIVHSDLKRTNLLVAKNSSGKHVAKIIDMDKSYFADKIRPDELGGDQSFMSPELAQCFIYDMADEALAYMSTKSDIYSLGLIFYNYMTGGEFPKFQGLSGALKNRMDSGENVYCGEASLSGAKLVLSSKIGEPYLSHLIASMLQTEPEDRPTAQEVLQALKMKTVMELKPTTSVLIEGEAVPTERTPDPEPIPDPIPDPDPVPEGFCAPWDEHDITLDEEALRASGFIAMEQYETRGAKCYKVYKSKGGYSVYSGGNLVLAGFAKDNKKASSSRGDSSSSRSSTTSIDVAVEETDELWEEDSAYAYNTDAIRERGLKGIKRAMKGRIKGYVLIKNDDSQRFLTIETLKILGYIVNK